MLNLSYTSETLNGLHSLVDYTFIDNEYFFVTLFFAIPTYFFIFCLFLFLRLNTASLESYRSNCHVPNLKLKTNLSWGSQVKILILKLSSFFLLVLFVVYNSIESYSSYLFFSHIFISGTSFNIFLFLNVTFLVFFKFSSFITFKTTILSDLLRVLLLLALLQGIFFLFSSSNLYSIIFSLELIATTLLATLALVLFNTSLKNFLLSLITLFWFNTVTSLFLFIFLISLMPYLGSFDLDTLYIFNLTRFSFKRWDLFLPIVSFLIVIFFKLALPPTHFWKLFLFDKVKTEFLNIYIILYFPFITLYFILLLFSNYSFIKITADISMIALPATLFVTLTLVFYYKINQSWGLFLALSSIFTVTLIILSLFTFVNSNPNTYKLFFRLSLNSTIFYLFLYTITSYLVIAFFQFNSRVFAPTLYLNSSLFVLNSNSESLTPRFFSKFFLFIYFFAIAGLPPVSLFFVKLNILSLFNFSIFLLALFWFLFFFLVLIFYYSNVRFILTPLSSRSYNLSIPLLNNYSRIPLSLNLITNFTFQNSILYFSILLLTLFISLFGWLNLTELSLFISTVI